MEYTTIQQMPEDADSLRIRAIFQDIEKKARLTGRAGLLMQLDRVPCLVLGASNKIPQGALAQANAEALATLEQIAEIAAAEAQPNAPAQL
jgi:hypothetical protein